MKKIKKFSKRNQKKWIFLSPILLGLLFYLTFFLIKIDRSFAALPENVDKYIIRYNQNKKDHGFLVDAISRSNESIVNPDLPYYLTLMPKDINSEGKPIDPSAINPEFVIPGEYGFSPRFNNKGVEEGGSQVFYVKKSGPVTLVPRPKEDSEKKIEENKDVPGSIVFSMDDFINTTTGKKYKNYLIFTNMGNYRGSQIDVKMEIKDMADTIGANGGRARGVTIGVQGNPGLNSATIDDVSVNQAMSVSNTGSKYLGSKTPNPVPSYVEIEYSFYKHPINFNPEDPFNSPEFPGDSSPINIQGFLTFVDFDYEESIGISNDANIKRIYALRTQPGDQDYRKIYDTMDPYKAQNSQDYYDMLAYRFPPAILKDPSTTENRSNNNFNELTYSVQPPKGNDPGSLYINRFNIGNVKANSRGNWFSFTYGPTKKFTINFNATHGAARHGKKYVGDPQVMNEIFYGMLNDPSHPYNQAGAPINIPNKEGYYVSTLVSGGSTIGFFPVTLGPIKFPTPIKTADKDTSDQKIVWTIKQDVPPRFLKNGEPQFVIEDEFDEVLTLNKSLTGKDSIKIIDAYGNDVTNETFPLNGVEKNVWKITFPTASDPAKDKFRIEVDKDYLMNAEFYQNSYTIIATTNLNPAKENVYMTDKYIDKKNSQLKIPNQSILYLKNVDFSTSTTKSAPGYDEPSGKSYGYIDIEGQIEIEKRAEKKDGTPGKLLPGAEFKILDEDDQVVVAKAVTDSNGKWLSKKLPAGRTYKIVETKAPAGYDLVADTEVKLGLGVNKITLVDPIRRPGGELTISKQVFDEAGNDIDGKPVKIGQKLKYRLTVSNSHTDPFTLLKDMELADEIKPYLDFQGDLELSGQINQTDLSVVTEKGKKSIKTVKKLRLDGGQSFTISYHATVNNQASDKVSNTLKVIAFANVANEGDAEKIEKSATVTNPMSVTIYLRQFLLKGQTDLVEPLGGSAGFAQVADINAQGDEIVTINKSIVSTKNIEDVTYTKTSLYPSANSNKHTFKLIVPEMYQYVGYILTNKPNQSVAQLIKQDQWLIEEIDSDQKYYITLVIQPSQQFVNQSIPFYNWSYKLNQFTKSIQVK